MDDDSSKYSLGEGIKAEAVYEQQSGRRQAVVDMGRKMAGLTVPSIFPPESYQAGDDLPGTNQSVGAMCVNTLGSHLMLMAFPPSQPIMGLDPDEQKLRDEIDADPELWAATQLALGRLEMSHRKTLMATPLATAYVGYVKLLLVAGNALWKHLRLAHPTYHKPDSYVVIRNKMGMPLLTIHKESVNLMGMDKDHVAFIMSNVEPTRWKNTPEWEREVDVYSICRVHVDDDGEPYWTYWEEWEGKTLPDTGVETDFDDPPMWPGWLIPVYGDNWGRGYCEEYRGDLYAMEAHASAGNDLSSAAALALMFVKPGTPTSIKQVREADNLAVLPGDAADVTMFRSEKGGDAQITQNSIDTIARRLSAAFLLQASIQRSGERVTAEEIKRLGNELDKAMGGLYTAIAQGNQKVVVVRAVHLNEAENKSVVKLPKGLVTIRITTGLDAMGQSVEVDTLKDFAATMQTLFPKTSERLIDGSDFAKRLAAGQGIKPDGLVRTPEQLEEQDQRDQQAMMTQEMVSKGTGPAIKGIADAVASGGQPQLPEGAQ